jgi:hypothetical protein
LSDSDLRIFFWTVKTGEWWCSEDTFQIFPGRTDKNHDQLQGRAKTFGYCVSVYVYVSPRENKIKTVDIAGTVLYTSVGPSFRLATKHKGTRC